MPRRKKPRKNYPSKPNLIDDNQHIGEDETLVPGPQSPLRTPKSRCSIRSTPVNKRRRSHRRSGFNRTLNVTNLNILFDSSYINQNIPPTKEEMRNSSDSSQTIHMDNSESHHHHHDHIVETPKLSLIDEFVSDLKSPTFKHSFQKMHYLNAANVNLNPYAKHTDIKLVNNFHNNKETSLGEISFFDQHLNGVKSASTPIHNNMMKNNKTPVIVIPNVTNNVTCGENFSPAPRKKELNRPKSDISIIHNVSRVGRIGPSMVKGGFLGGPESILTRLKRYSRTSIRWSFKIVDFCSYIGVALRRTISSICGELSIEGAVERPLKTDNCKCNDYQKEVVSLTTKLDEMKAELCSVKILMDGNRRESEVKFTLMETELRQVKGELEELLLNRGVLKERSQVAGPPAPPPPPPPPPPLPPMRKASPMKLPRKANRSNKENSRPIISLDEILKVKLKKTTERPPSLRRNSQQPMVSMEMLRQVKLKPASRPQTPTSSHSVDGITPTSPHSSLTKLLNDNNSTQRDREAGPREDAQLTTLLTTRTSQPD